MGGVERRWPTRLRLGVMCCATCLAAIGSAAQGTPPSPPIAPDQRVRAQSDRILSVVAAATARSSTFRGLVQRISETDGLVYVEEGECGQGARACLVHAMTIMGPYRMLRIRVDGRAADRELMVSIGHELQHALEVFGRPSIRDSSGIVLLYKEICNACGSRFETDEAILAGIAVRDELQKSAAPQDTTRAWEQSRVRSDSPTLARVIRDAADRSATFRSVVARINATNGLVYVHEAHCPGLAKACLFQDLQRSGPNRVLRIGVTITKRDDISVAGSIGHELQHAFEVLEDPHVTTTEDMVGVWLNGMRLTTERFETSEATQTGIRIHEELRGNRGAR